MKKSNSLSRRTFVSMLIIAIVFVFSAPAVVLADTTGAGTAVTTASSTDSPIGIKFTPRKTSYKIGDEFKEAGRLYYVYETKERYVSNPQGVTFSGFDSSTPGTQTITVKYENFTTTFDIEIAADPLKIKSQSLSCYDYVYSGNPAKPKVTLKDADGNVISSEYYDVTYENNISVGTAMAVITFKGIYSSTSTRYLAFRIAPKGTKIVLLSPGVKKMVVALQGQKDQTTGYEIRYSLKKNMANAKSVRISNSIACTTLKNLKAKKTYYIQVRTYAIKKLNGKNTEYKSAWSKVYSKKTK